MSIYYRDTFSGGITQYLTQHVGEIGAVYAAHPYYPMSGAPSVNARWWITDDGYIYPLGLNYAWSMFELSSAVVTDSEYDIRWTMKFDGGRLDGQTGFGFKANTTDGKYWKVVWDNGWRIVKHNNDNGTIIEQWNETIADGSTRSIEVRVRTANITVYVDGILRLTAANDFVTGGERMGPWALGVGNNPSGGIRIAEISSGSVGFQLPDYEVTGPSQLTPDAPSQPYTVALSAGYNPGTITITPAAVGMTGTFVPTSVTLTDADRSDTFTFAPSGEGSGTLTFSDNAGAVDAPAVPFNSAFLPPDRLDFWHGTLAKFTPAGTNPYLPDRTNREGGAGYWLDGFDHYDPQLVYYNLRDYAARKGLSIPNLDEQIQAGSVRVRDRAIIAWGRPGHGDPGLPGTGVGYESAGVQLYHNYIGGIVRHYAETGDWRDVTAVNVMSPLSYGNDPFIYRLTSTNIGVQREWAFRLQGWVDMASVGLGENAAMDALARQLLHMIELWTEPYETKHYGIWLKPFMGGLVARALIHYWHRYRNSAVAEKVEICGMIPGHIKAFSDYLFHPGDVGTGQPTVWFPEGVDDGTGWTHGSITYRDLPNDDPKYALIGPGLAVTAVGTPANQVFYGPNTLSTVDGYYKFSTLYVAGTNDGATIVDYEGATRKITVDSAYPVSRNVTTSDTFEIKPMAYVTDEGAGPAAELNGLVFPVHAWAYWHERRVVGNYVNSMVYRNRAHVVFNGNYQSWNQAQGQKQWNQSLLWVPEGLAFLERGDNEWPVASSFTLSPPADTSRAFANRTKVFQVSLPDGYRIDATETVTPTDNSSTATLGPNLLIDPLLRVGAVNWTPAAGDVGSGRSVGASGSSLGTAVPQSVQVSAALIERDEAVSVYQVSGPRRIALNHVADPANRDEWFFVTLGAGTVEGSIRFTPQSSAGTGTFEPAFYDLTNEVRGIIIRYIPTSEGVRTISFTNNGGLPNPPGIQVQTDARTPGAPISDYTLTGPSEGDVWTDSEEFTVTLSSGEVTGTYRFFPYESAETHGLGDFYPMYFDLTDNVRSATFVYRPYSVGPREIGFFGMGINAEDVLPEKWVPYESLATEGDGSVSSYVFNGPNSAAVGEPVSFSVVLGSGSVDSPIRFTPQASGGSGSFTPAYADLTNESRTAIFQYVASSVGLRTINVSNNAGLSGSPSIEFNATESTRPAVDESSPVGQPVVIMRGGRINLIIPYTGR